MASHEHSSAAVEKALAGSLNPVLNLGNQRAQAALRKNQEWGQADADQWHLDQDTGLLTFSFTDRAVAAAFQFLGSYNASAGTWLWAWGNESIDAPLKADSLQLKDWGERVGEPVLTTPSLVVPLEDADCMALVALAKSRYDGFYKAPDGDLVTFLSFGPAQPV